MPYKRNSASSQKILLTEKYLKATFYYTKITSFLKHKTQTGKATNKHPSP